MEASMQDAMEKMVSLTYMAVSEWYLPWRVSGHGTEIRYWISVQNILKQ